MTPDSDQLDPLVFCRYSSSLATPYITQLYPFWSLESALCMRALDCMVGVTCLDFLECCCHEKVAKSSDISGDEKGKTIGHMDWEVFRTCVLKDPADVCISKKLQQCIFMTPRLFI